MHIDITNIIRGHNFFNYEKERFNYTRDAKNQKDY